MSGYICVAHEIRQAFARDRSGRLPRRRRCECYSSCTRHSQRADGGFSMARPEAAGRSARRQRRCHWVRFANPHADADTGAPRTPQGRQTWLTMSTWLPSQSGAARRVEDGRNDQCRERLKSKICARTTTMALLSGSLSSRREFRTHERR